MSPASWPRHLLSVILALCLSSCAPGPETSVPSKDRIIPFRAMLAGYGLPDSSDFWNKDAWSRRFARWGGEGYNAVILYGPNELTSGEHLLSRHAEFPEAREIPPEENERRVAMMTWMFEEAKRNGLNCYLMAQPLFLTRAFAKAHGLEVPLPLSSEACKFHNTGYPDFWRGGKTVACGVRNELARAYTESVFAEIARTYPALDGFYGFLGECLPGDRSTFFKEAILPGLKRSGRSPHMILSQWQVPIDGFVENVVAPKAYTPLWTSFHGYNSEQITDAKPYPGVVEWSEKTGLPTVVDIYPANQLYFPFNSPRFAYEIAREMGKVDGIAGFVYWERHVSGTLLGPLFRKALAHYAATPGPYDPERWATLLEKKFGDHAAAEHFLRAYDFSARIIPETCALVYSGGDVIRRELRMPFAFFVENQPWNCTTSPARGNHLIPIRQYAIFAAMDPGRFKDNDGSDLARNGYYQQPIWGSEGGSVYDVTPPAHMRKVRALGEACLREAEEGLAAARSNRDEAVRVRDLMKASQLLASYYEEKVGAAVAAISYSCARRAPDREEALRRSDRALETYRELIAWMKERLDPYYIALCGQPLTEAGEPLDRLLELEIEDRKGISRLFQWSATE